MDEKLLLILVSSGATLAIFFLGRMWDVWWSKSNLQYEDRKLLRHSLFELLKFWVLLEGSGFDRYLDASIENIKQLFIKEGHEPEDVQKMFEEDAAEKVLILNYQLEQLKPTFIECENSLIAVMSDLAKIKPLMAVEIASSGLSRRIFNFSELAEHARNRGISIEVKPYSINLGTGIDNRAKIEAIKRTAANMKEYCLIIAKDIDQKTLSETTKFIEDYEKQLDKFEDPLNPEFEEATQKLIEMVKLAAQDSSSLKAVNIRKRKGRNEK